MSNTSASLAFSHPPAPSLSRRGFVATATIAGGAAAMGLGMPLAVRAAPKFPGVVNYAQIGEGKAEPGAVLRYNMGGFDLSKSLGGAKIDWKPGFPASLPVVEAMRAGAIDFSFVTSTALIYAIGGNVPIVPLVSYPLPANEVDILVYPDSGIKTIQDLKGKRVADHRGTTSTYSLVRSLEAAGMTLADIQYVNLPGPDAASAFANKRVDAWITWQPGAELNVRRLNATTLPNVKTYDYAFFVATEKFANEYPEAAAILARTARDAQRYIEAKPDEVVAKFGELGGFGSNKLEQQVYLDLVKSSRLSFSGAGQLNLVDEKTASDIQSLADSFYALKIYPAKINVKDWMMDKRFESVRRVVAQELAKS
jgi:sulfonate transport system substrate-binding protein